MATIVNNELTADETKLRVVDPFLYVNSPKNGRPANGAELYFGIPGRDPELPEHQKIVYALQEDGSAVALAQPVLTNAAGRPTYNGSVVGLAVSGSYSYKAIYKDGSSPSYQPKIVNKDNQGFSGVIAEEAVTVGINGQPENDFTSIEATTASFYASTNNTGLDFNGRYMRKGVDYQVVSPTQITLLTSYAIGTTIVGRQADPTGQIIPTAEGATALFVFQTIAEAKQADLQLTDTATINGAVTSGDGLGGGKYLTVAGGTGTGDDENFINLNNGNQLQLIPETQVFKRYVEVISTPQLTSGNLNINLEDGGVQEITLTENVTDVLFANVNTLSGRATTLTLKVTQANGTLFDITWPLTIKWSGGVAPGITQTDDAIDIFVFTTFDGANWFGSTAGQAFA